MHVSLKGRLLLGRHIFISIFAISRNSNFVPSEEIFYEKKNENSFFSFEYLNMAKIFGKPKYFG